MSNLYTRPEMGLMEMSTGPSVVDTSGYGGVYNTASGSQGLMGMLNDGWNKVDFGSAKTWGNMGQLMGGVGALGNMALGFKSLGLMEDQLGLQQSQWNESLAELNTMRGVRSKTNAAYA